MNGDKTLWLIPARGGSKGIPGKNLKDFCGRPLVCRAIDQALECAGPEDEILVSTDSREIKEAAMSCGIDVPFLRPYELATDTASTYSVIMHAISEYASRGIRFSRVVLLQPTSPLRETSDIIDAVRLWSRSVDMVVTVCQARTNPYYNGFETTPEGYLHVSKGEGGITRRQDAPEVWEYNGAVYVMTVDSLKKGPMSSFTRILPSPMPAERSIDLDSPTDWLIAETIASHRKPQ